MKFSATIIPAILATIRTSVNADAGGLRQRTLDSTRNSSNEDGVGCYKNPCNQFNSAFGDTGENDMFFATDEKQSACESTEFLSEKGGESMVKCTWCDNGGLSYCGTVCESEDYSMDCE